ncbi:hypothetical protein H0H81_003730 [Sphagnurus paluster]|uniref:Protein S-acyltransferase n=1 Tax=Sphagnurus paluster TaxID=117069 RepID=A0A9P7FWL9_9AGAR|nr:hypothetical protein H0H81_003730 [Sphagnurus paluster]
MGARYWDEPSTIEIVFTILNYVACVPVFLAVGGFSIYHFYCLLGNTTTIEGWEKDKVATMVRRGKLQAVGSVSTSETHRLIPIQNLGRRKNIESVLGKNMLLWCWPSSAPGTGLRYELAEGDDGSVSWPPRDPVTQKREEQGEHELVLPSSPWTYENGSVNPDLEPSNSSRRRNVAKRQTKGVSLLPPYHPDYQEGEQVVLEQSEDDSCSDDYSGHPRIRSGSEGYEVRPVDREELLHRYLREVGEEPARYHRYIPTPESDNESDEDTWQKDQ